jgi:hypothetical protein
MIVRLCLPAVRHTFQSTINMIEFTCPRLIPFIQALMATLFTWGLTALGAWYRRVCHQKVNPKLLMDTALGFAGGVMIAASFWSLLAPSIEMAVESRDDGLGTCSRRFYRWCIVHAAG